MLIDDYLSIVGAFVDGRSPVDAFEKRYLATFKSETRAIAPAVFQVLDHLFGCVDAYCGDPALRDDEDLDEEQLHEAATGARAQLLDLKQGSNGG